MGFWDRLNADYARRAGEVPARRPASQEAVTGYGRRPPEETPPGGFSFGTSWFGGPYYVDPYNSRRAPSPFKLIENYGKLIYAMVSRKRDAVSKVQFRLFADASRAQGKPGKAADPIAVPRHVAAGHYRAGKISAGAVDKVVEIRNHPLLDALDKPDPYGYFDRTKLIGLLCSYMDVVGSAFLVPEGNGWDWTQQGERRKGPPEILWVVYPQYVIPVRYGSTPLINYWQYFRDYLPFESALWFRQSISLRDAYGSAFSPTYAGDMYQDQEGRFVAYYDFLFGNGAKPQFVVTAKDPAFPPGENERKRFEQDLNRRQAGGNMGGLLVNNGAWDFTPLNFAPVDMGAKDMSEYDRNCLAAIFGVPPTYFTTDTNLANLEAADEYFARFGVEPMCKAIAGPLTALARSWDPRLYVEHDPVIAEDELNRAQVDKIYVDMGAVTINQLNEEKKYPPVAWGDAPWLPGTLKQPDMIMADHEAGLEAQKASIEQGEAGVEHDGKRIDLEEQKARQQGEAAKSKGKDKADAKRQMIDRALDRLERELRRHSA